MSCLATKQARRERETERKMKQKMQKFFELKATFEKDLVVYAGKRAQRDVVESETSEWGDARADFVNASTSKLLGDMEKWLRLPQGELSERAIRDQVGSDCVVNWLRDAVEGIIAAQE